MVATVLTYVEEADFSIQSDAERVGEFMISERKDGQRILNVHVPHPELGSIRIAVPVGDKSIGDQWYCNFELDNLTVIPSLSVKDTVRGETVEVWHGFLTNGKLNPV